MFYFILTVIFVFAGNDHRNHYRRYPYLFHVSLKFQLAKKVILAGAGFLNLFNKKAPGSTKSQPDIPCPIFLQSGF